MFGGADPVGQRVRYTTSARQDHESTTGWLEIVGVVSDLHTNPIDRELKTPVIYQPLIGKVESGGSILLRTTDGSPATHISRLREIVADVDSTVRLTAYPLVDIYRQRTVANWLMSVAIVLVVVSVLLLSAAGVYALMSFTVSQRRKEIGIRAALGADSTRILGSIFARSAGQLTAGIAAGVATALVIDAVSGGEILSGQSGTFLPLMCIVMFTVGLLASIGPARRGLRVPPTQALRDE